MTGKNNQPGLFRLAHSGLSRVFVTPAAVLLTVLLVNLLLPSATLAEQRFPPPDFESGHVLPGTATPPARAIGWDYVDITVLAGCLGVAAWLIYRKRSRRGILALSIFSLLYFGFWRNGCICAIGAFQNVALALGDKSYALPLAAGAFFILPVMVALFAGRAFCSGVCPHGALQDLVLIKPLKVPAWLEHGLSVVPFFYLGLGVLLAATGSMFVVCQYDPFVSIFRMNGRSAMVIAAVALLVLGAFVGRPYCRFLCPLGAMLKLGSTVAKWRVRVTPDLCTQCRLCEASCPFGAMREPEAPKLDHATLARDRKRLAFTFALLPVLIIVGVWLGSLFGAPASRLNSNVALAERFLKEQGSPAPSGPLGPDELALQRARENPGELLEKAIAIRKQFRVGGMLFGGWMGLVIGAKLISLNLRRKRTDYEPDRGDCFACARCFEYCPNELARRGIVPASFPAIEPAGRGTTPAPASKEFAA